jgi:hypothetical protein
MLFPKNWEHILYRLGNIPRYSIHRTMCPLCMIFHSHEETRQEEGILMKNPIVVTRTPARSRLSALGKLTVAAVIGLPLLLSTDFFAHGVNVTNLLFTGIALILAAIITGIIMATRWRWVPLLGALVYGALLALFIPVLPYALSHPTETYSFALNVVLLALAVVGIGAGIGATVQNYRKGEREPRAPRWLGVSLSGLAGIVVGMLIVSLIVNDSSIEHVLQNGSWDAHGTPQAGVEPGAPTLRNVEITGGSREIGPFATAGVYHIYCTLHQGMNLTIVVQ